MGQHITLNTSKVGLSDIEKALLKAINNNKEILLKVSPESPLASVFQTDRKTSNGIPESVHIHEVTNTGDCLHALNFIFLNGEIETLKKTHIGPECYNRPLLGDLLAPDDPALKYQMRANLLKLVDISPKRFISPNNDDGIIASHPRLFFFRAASPRLLESVSYKTDRLYTPSIRDILDIPKDSDIDASDLNRTFAVLARPYTRPNDTDGEIHWKVSNASQISTHVEDGIRSLLTPNGSRLAA